jgi:exodeoxyribonuclease VII large subunit
MVLKDEKAQIRAVMFRLQSRYLKFLPENGMKVIAQGRIGLYAPRGEYQIILDYLEPMGVGALALAFEQLKKKLADQGIFDKHIKKPLPYLPQRVAVITSPTGAAIRDFLNVLRRRFANIDITVVPVRVQGNEAASDMVKALQIVNDKLNADVIVLTRGGGSLEDLWAFNEEELALAIRRSRIPVVSAVGHEIDMTISDLAADFRAPTPSAAAELLVMEKETLIDRLDKIKRRLASNIFLIIKYQTQELEHLVNGIPDPKKRIEDAWMQLDEIHSRLARGMSMIMLEQKTRLNADGKSLLLHSPMHILSSTKQQLGFQKTSLTHALKSCLEKNRAALSLLEKGINDLNPLSILKRGYSITRKLPEETVLRDASGIQEGDQVQVLLSKGGIKCRVERVESDKKI